MGDRPGDAPWRRRVGGRRRISAQRATAPVVVGIGDRSARLCIARIGVDNVLELSEAVRAELGVAIGDAVEVTIALDIERCE